MSGTGRRKRGRSESPEIWVGTWATERVAGEMVVGTLEAVEDNRQVAQHVLTLAVEEGRGNAGVESDGELGQAEAAQGAKGLPESGTTGEVGEMPVSGGIGNIEEFGEPEEAGEAGEAGGFAETGQGGETGETGEAGVAAKIGEFGEAGQTTVTGKIGETVGASDIGEIGATEEIEETNQFSDISDNSLEAVSEYEEAEKAQLSPKVEAGPMAGDAGGNLHEIGAPQVIELVPENQCFGGISGGGSGGPVASGGEESDILPAIDEEQQRILENMAEANNLPLSFLHLMFLDLVRLLMQCINSNDDMHQHVPGGLSSGRNQSPRSHHEHPQSFLIEPGRLLVPFGEASAYNMGTMLDAEFLNGKNVTTGARVEAVLKASEHQGHATSQETTGYLMENSDEGDTDPEIEKCEEHNEVVAEAETETANEGEGEEEKKNEKAQEENFNPGENPGP